MYIYIYIYTVRQSPAGLPRGRRRRPDARQPFRRLASKQGQDKRVFCRSAAIYHNYDIIMA